jgi:DNA invertase Pin-like site-specific DNA recombinase
MPKRVSLSNDASLVRDTDRLRRRVADLDRLLHDMERLSLTKLAEPETHARMENTKTMLVQAVNNLERVEKETQRRNRPTGTRTNQKGMHPVNDASPPGTPRGFTP